MASDLIWLVYRSDAVGLRPERNLEDIVAVSVWKNARRRITGALGHCAGRYVQLLEGPREAVDALMAELEADTRHASLVVLGSGPAHARLVPGWTMARADLAGLHEPIAELLDRENPGAEIAARLALLVQRGETGVA